MMTVWKLHRLSKQITFFSILIGGLVISPMVSWAQEYKIALLDITKVERQYFKNIELAKDIYEKASKLSEHRGFEIHEKLMAEGKGLMEKVNAISDPTEKKPLQQLLDSKIKEIKDLEKELFDYKRKFEKKLMAEKLKARSENLKEIFQAAEKFSQKLSKEQGYHFVFESGGQTSSNLPPILYVRNGDDFTDEFLAILNKDAPPKEEAAEPKSTPIIQPNQNQ